MAGTLVSAGGDGGGAQVGSGAGGRPGGGFTSVIGYRRRAVDCIDVFGSTVERRCYKHSLLLCDAVLQGKQLRALTPTELSS